MGIAHNARAATDADLAVSVANGTKSFGERTIFTGVDLDIRRGEFVALLGASGSGKTTLLRILLGLDRLDGGVGHVATPRSVVFQEPRLVPSQPVWRNVLMGTPRTRDSKARAVRALAEVNLAGHADAWPGTLSGGEAQRVALARALFREPRLLLLDEPFAALDALTRLKMQDLVKQLCADHTPGVLLVTHDVDEAIRLADRVLVLSKTRITVDIRLGADKDPTSPEIVAIRRRLLAELGVNPPAATDTAIPEAAPTRELLPLDAH